MDSPQFPLVVDSPHRAKVEPQSGWLPLGPDKGAEPQTKWHTLAHPFVLGLPRFFANGWVKSSGMG